jgi:hypothetical protein
MRTGFELRFSEFGMGITMADFQAVGKNPNINIRLKKFNEVDKRFVTEISYRNS